MKDTAVVILNWNGKKFLSQFLEGVIRHSSEHADIIVADNDSSDGSVEWMQENHPGIQLIRNDENGGFAKGYNDALSQLPHTYFLLLNSDIEVKEGWIAPLIGRIKSDPNIFAVQPGILAWHQQTHFEYAGAAGGLIDMLGYPFCRGRLFDSTEKDLGQYDKPADIFWASGACMLLRADIFRELGGFDASFFAHMEEIDLCWRALNRGYRNVYEPGSRVFHIGGGTLPKNSPRKTFLNFRNNLLLLYKNLPLSSFLLVYLLRIVLDAVAALKFITAGGWQDAAAVVRAHFRFIGMLPKTRRDRQRNRLGKHKQVYKGSIVMAYYLRGMKDYPSLGMDESDLDSAEA